ncbi:U32 family peptidase [Ruminococcus sp. AF14-10]|nr:U32 family peptidase [Ruminococcus sp. AF14-10]
MVQSGFPEVLAPAGSYESFHAAIAAGADAVYLAGNLFGARAFAQNFSEEELLHVIDEAHLHGRKIYLTVNTLLKEKELEEKLYTYLEPYYNEGLDAVIVQDYGVLRFIRQHFPGLALHASTQMTVTGPEGASLLADYGVERVVPARELSLKEVETIKKATQMEMECFVHGALCYCYSGQCLMSSMIGGRSGNRGQCAQPCRLPYTYKGKNGYLMSLKDICTLESIPDLIEHGIDSFKIEGRMKKPEYVAGVTAMYRKYTDLYLEHGREKFRVKKSDLEELMDLYNRGGFHSGYYFVHNGPEMLCTNRPNHAGTKAAKVLGQKGRELQISVLKDLSKGDVLEFPSGHGDYTLGKDWKKGERQTILLPKNQREKKGAWIFRTRCNALLQRLNQTYVNAKLQEPISGRVVLKPGEKAVLELRFTGRNGTKTVIRVKGERIAPAENRPLTEEQVTKALAKTGNTPFYFETLDVKLEGDCFCPMQQLNTLRRQGIEELEKAVLNGFRRTSADVGQQDMTDTVSDLEKRADNTAGNLRTSVLAETLEQLEAMWEFLESALESSEMEQSLRRIYLDFELFLGKETPEKTREICRKFQQKKIQIFLALPHISRGNLDGKLKSLLLAEKETVDGVLIRNLESLGMLRKIGFDKSVIADHNLYILNHEAKKFLKEEGISEYTASLELNAKELSGLDLTDCEGVVYGYIPVMESAQCLEKTCFGCKKASGRDEMADRLGHRFSMRRVCTFCYNVIYNTDPQVLFSEMDTLRRVKVSSCRLHFTGESKAETKQILSLYTQAYAQDPVWPENLNYTKGHFRRGIK